MNELEWYPEIRIMTITAVAGRRKMTGVLTGRGGAVVTGRTRAGNAVVIEVSRNPCVSRMTIITLGDSLNVLGILAGRRYAVVAARTGSGQDGAMIKNRRQPGIRRMTVIADIAAGDVI